MKNLNAIGLDIKKSKKLAEQLNALLANYAIFYQNLRGYHWKTLSSEAGDEGTNAQMSDYIRAQEKMVWMYSSFLDKK